MPSLDLATLADRLAPVGVTDLKPLAGGASSLTYAGVRREQRVVVKVAPPGVAPVLHRDVLRQAALLRALAASPVPVPAVLHEDAGAPVDVPPLFVMSFLEGSSLEPLFDVQGEAVEPDVVAARMRDAAQVLARLHAIDPAGVGLSGEPVVPIVDELERWCRTLRTVDAELVPRFEDVADGLRAFTPRGVASGIVHGDFRLGNLLAVDRTVTAIIDWEIWCVGDPRVDLGWFLLNADPDTYRRATPYVGRTPTPEELLDAYEAERGATVSDPEWFVALAAFKSAATWALIVKHNRRRAEPDPEVEAMAVDLPLLLERARDL